MFRRVLQSFPLIALLVTAALLGGPASASAATQLVTNGDFETGTLEGWTTTDQIGKDNFVAYSRKEIEEEEIFFAPPSGEHAAYVFTPTDLVDTIYLYQGVTLPAATDDQLSMYLYYAAGSPLATPDPNTLAASSFEGAQPNQQIRVDVLKANAPIESLSPNDILATIYASQAGDPLELEPTLLNADLSAFAGQAVRLRIAVAVQADEMEVGVDDVSIDSAPLPTPQPQPQPRPAAPLPSNVFSTGKLVLDRRHGGAKLDVTLPGPGRLTVADARREIAIASVRADPSEKPILIRTASAQTTGPRTVRVFLRPTPAAKRLLGKNGRLRFRLQLTFRPEGGLAGTQGYSGTLLKTVKQPRR